MHRKSNTIKGGGRGENVCVSFFFSSSFSSPGVITNKLNIVQLVKRIHRKENGAVRLLSTVLVQCA